LDHEAINRITKWISDPITLYTFRNDGGIPITFLPLDACLPVGRGEDKGGGEPGLIPHFNKGGRACRQAGGRQGGFKDRKKRVMLQWPFF